MSQQEEFDLIRSRIHDQPTKSERRAAATAEALANPRKSTPPVDTKGTKFDQFKLADQLGGDYITSARLMALLRILRTKGPVTGGDLAGRCGERLSRPEWPMLLNKLVQFGYITTKPTGHGLAITVTLTALGLAFMEDTIGPEVHVTEETQPEV
jgi:hypothetical protein